MQVATFYAIRLPSLAGFALIQSRAVSARRYSGEMPAILAPRLARGVLIGVFRTAVLAAAFFANDSRAQDVPNKLNELRGVARVIESAREDACGQLWNRVRALPWDSGLDIGTVFARDADAEAALRGWIVAQPIREMPRVYPDGVVHVDVALSLPHLSVQLREFAKRESIGGLPGSGWQGVLTLVDVEEIVARGVARGGSDNVAADAAARRDAAVEAAKALVAAKIVRQMETVKLSPTRILAQRLEENPALRWKLQQAIMPVISFAAPRESSGIVLIAGNIVLRDIANPLLEMCQERGAAISVREFLQLNGSGSFRAVAEAVIPPADQDPENLAAAFRWGDQTISAIGSSDDASSTIATENLTAPPQEQGNVTSVPTRVWNRFLRGVLSGKAVPAHVEQSSNTPPKEEKNFRENYEIRDEAHLVEIARQSARDALALTMRTLPASESATVGALAMNEDAIARTLTLMLEDATFSSPTICDDGSVEIRAELNLTRLAEVLLWFETFQRAMQGTGG